MWDSVGENSETFQRLVFPCTRTSLGEKRYPIQGIIVDRRVAKLIEGLQRIDSVNAEQIVISKFEKDFDELKVALETGDNKSLGTGADHSLYGHFFLCSEFCSPDNVVKKIDEWNEWCGEARIVPYRKNFDINLYANTIMRSRGLTIEETNALLATKLAPAFVGSHSPQLHPEFMLTSDSIPGQAEILKIVPVLAGPSVSLNPDRLDQALQILREELIDGQEAPNN